VTLTWKFARDLEVGDVIVDGIGFPPVLQHVNGRAVLHHTEVVGKLRDVEGQVNFDPRAHNQDQNATDGSPASPPTMHMRRDDSSIPTVRVLMAGFQNRERLDQAPVEQNVRLFHLIGVFTGDLDDLIEQEPSSNRKSAR
jgi:hypothetical protein